MMFITKSCFLTASPNGTCHIIVSMFGNAKTCLETFRLYTLRYLVTFHHL